MCGNLTVYIKRGGGIWATAFRIMSRKVNIKWIIQLVLILWLSFHIRHHARITPRRHWAGEHTSTRSLIEGKPRVICCSVIPATNHKILMLLRWPDLSIPGGGEQKHVSICALPPPTFACWREVYRHTVSGLWHTPRPGVCVVQTRVDVKL